MNRRTFFGAVAAMGAMLGLRVRAQAKPVGKPFTCKHCGEFTCLNLLPCQLAHALKRADQAERAYAALTMATPPTPDADRLIPGGHAPGVDPDGGMACMRSMYFGACEDIKWYHNAFWAQKRRAEAAERAMGILYEPGNSIDLDSLDLTGAQLIKIQTTVST